MKTGLELIQEERKRQITEEGFHPSDDDKYDSRELARAATAYVSHYVERAWTWTNELGMPGVKSRGKSYQMETAPDVWPWKSRFWNPQNPLRDLVKAGALIAAEIDRLQRKQENT